VIWESPAREKSAKVVLAPVIEAWNAGEIRATGKGYDVLAAAIEIPAPANLWNVRVMSLEHSIIVNPNGGPILDLRFHVVDKSVKPSKATASVQWLDKAVKDLKLSGELPKKPTDVARLLHRKMVVEVRRGFLIKVLGVDTIVNYLRERKSLS
jgi:hypothetical protein